MRLLALAVLLFVAAAALSTAPAGAEAHERDPRDACRVTDADVGGAAPPPRDTGYAGGAVTVALFGHIFDLLQPVPMNTQPMNDADLARGFGTPTVAEAQGEGLNAMRFYLSPGLVEYNTTENGIPRVHPERGVSFDILLDASQDVIGHWFMSVRPLDVPQLGSPGGGGPEAGPMPAFTVRMTLREGDDPGADLDSGELVAQGATTLPPEAWAAQGPTEFVVNLGKPVKDRVDGNAAMNLKVEWFNADTPAGQVAQRDWVLHTGSAYPNRVELAVANPIAIYCLNPQPVGDARIAFQTQLNSPLGNYDLDASSLAIEVTGPSTPRSISAPSIIQKSWIHNHHFEPVQVVWTWDWRAEGAAPGSYTVKVSGKTLQGTAFAEKTATFVLTESGAQGFDDRGVEVSPATTEGSERDSPLPSVLALPALALALLLFGGRRR